MAIPTPTYDKLRDEVKALIRAAATDACDFINDTASETGLEAWTVAVVRDQSIIMLALLLDPEHADIANLPQHLKDATCEFVNATIGFTILPHMQPS